MNRQHYPQLDGAMQKGAQIVTKGWPPEAAIAIGYSFRILTPPPYRTDGGSIWPSSSGPFTVTKEAVSDSHGGVILDISPTLEEDTANGSLILERREIQ